MFMCGERLLCVDAVSAPGSMLFQGLHKLFQNHLKHWHYNWEVTSLQSNPSQDQRDDGVVLEKQ